MAELVYFDVHAQFGARPLKPMQERWSLQHLLDDCDLAGIAAALVRHSQAQYYDPLHGNRRLLREIAPHRDRLHPCWAVVPPLVGDFPAAPELLQMLRDEGVRAAVTYPKSCGLPLHESLWRPLAEGFAAEQIPLLVSYGELGGWEAASRLLTFFAASPVILLDQVWSQWREVQLLLDLHPNLHLEFSAFQANRAIDYFGQRYGYQRCLFGTGQPQKAPGAARAFLDFHLGDPAAAQQVAAGNLTRLLGSGPTAPPPPGDWHDVLTAAQRAGQPLPCHLLDAHCHVLHDGGHYAGEHYAMVRGDAAGLLEIARRMGIAATALMSWNGTVSMDAAAGNEVTAAAVAQAPDELFGLLTLNPTHQSPAEMQQSIEHYHLGRGFRGLKPYQRTVIPYNHPSFDQWWEFGHRHRLYGLFHISVGGVQAVLDIARRYPHLHCLIAHSGGSYAFADQVISVATQVPNIYAELTLTPVTNGVVEYLVDALGPDRVLYGTDAPMRDPRPQLGWVVFTRLPEPIKRQILGENFRRILLDGDLPGHPLPRGVVG
ncbi:MAG: amidohydrolase family protein [Fimbriimonadaceae bacterium]|nr:amidohydrolase family protein [Fimbriimonadaceae bacterium]